MTARSTTGAHQIGNDNEPAHDTGSGDGNPNANDNANDKAATAACHEVLTVRSTTDPTARSSVGTNRSGWAAIELWSPSTR